MKSAFELAMERLGGDPLRDVSEACKQGLAEVDRVYDARVAQAKFDASARLAKATTAEAAEQTRQDLAVELASLERRRERDKDAIRKRA